MAFGSTDFDDKYPDESSHGSDDGCSSPDGHQENGVLSQDKHTALASRETKTVCRVRVFVSGVLLCSMATVAVIVNFELRNRETKKFKKQFGEYADKVLASLKKSFERTLGGFDALVVNMASEAKASSQTWPFVTVSFIPCHSMIVDIRTL